MVNIITVFVATLLAKAAVTSSASMRSEGVAMPTGSWPTSTGIVFLDEPFTVKSGQTYDGQLKTYARSNIKCMGQKESGWQTAVFVLEPGATLTNVIIGKDQMEGVHCEHNECTLVNVWWDDVCEDALSIKGGSDSSVTKVIGGGARSAEDKIIQHNGLGTVIIDGFYAQDFGKIYSSCGQCGYTSRKVKVRNVLAVDGRVSIVTVNQNLNDEATLENIKILGKKVDACQWAEGGGSAEPTKLGAGPSGALCQYALSTVSYA